MRTRSFAIALAGALLCAIPSAHAQDNSAAVEALFGEGKKLETEGKYSEACPKFLASYNLEHRVGTLLNLADCYEKNHQLASAWARFVEARTLAQRGNQQERADMAAQHATELEPKLSRLTINVVKPAPGLEVKRDGAAVGDGAYGVAVAVDSGKHTIEASAPDRKPWTGEVTVGDGADQKTFEVPELLLAPKPPPGSGTTVVEEKRGPGRTIAGLVIAGVGVVALGVGTGFGIEALGKNSDSNANGNCGADGLPNDCNSTGVGLRDDARTFGNVSTVLIVVGGVAVVAGLVVWLTAPSSRVRATVGFDGRMLRLGGAF
jgi:hypothetical protein